MLFGWKRLGYGYNASLLSLLRNGLCGKREIENVSNGLKKTGRSDGGTSLEGYQDLWLSGHR